MWEEGKEKCTNLNMIVFLFIRTSNAKRPIPLFHILRKTFDRVGHMELLEISRKLDLHGKDNVVTRHFYWEINILHVD